MKYKQEKVVELKCRIERACIECGLNLTVYDGQIGFVDQEERKIIAVWTPEYSMPPKQQQAERNRATTLEQLKPATITELKPKCFHTDTNTQWCLGYAVEDDDYPVQRCQQCYYSEYAATEREEND